MQLPDDFIQLVRPVFGEERFARFLQALSEESPVSIRMNPSKIGERREESEERKDLHKDCSSGAIRWW